MMRASVRRPPTGFLKTYQRFAIQRFENAALAATDRAATDLKGDLRGAFSGAGLGRLGMAFGKFSFLKSGRGVMRRGQNGFFAGARVLVRSQSDRTHGALQIYSEGGDIVPRLSKWLWIPSKDMQRLVGGRGNRRRTTPKTYMESGLESRIGPLVFVPGRHSGEALLVAKNVTVRSTGKANPRRMPNSGRPRAGREARDFIVLFVGIRRTSRAARVDPFGIASSRRAMLPQYFNAALGGSI